MSPRGGYQEYSGEVEAREGSSPMAQSTIEPHNHAPPNGDTATADEPLGVTQASPERVKVCQLKSISQFSMHIQVGDKEVTVIVDSAAEVSIISDKVYQSLKNPPKKLRE